MQQISEPAPPLHDLGALAALLAIELSIERARTQQGPEPRATLLRVGGRREHSVGARADRAHAERTQIGQRQDDGRNEVRPHVALQALAQLDAAGRRDAIVDENHVRRVHQRLLEGAVRII